MNKFEKFLNVSGLGDGYLHCSVERAAYFLYYHCNATREEDADLGTVAKYFEEAKIEVPVLDGVADEFNRLERKALVSRSNIPGRYKPALEDSEGKYKELVFERPSLSPLYYQRLPNGQYRRIGGYLDELKHFPQDHWVAAWISLAIGFFSAAFAIVNWLCSSL